MACRADRLSDLPDDLLLRVLHFAPTKEAASTTALSRGWRSPRWRSSGAVNLETRVEAYDPYAYGLDERKKREDEALFFSRRDTFVSAAKAAIDAADVPVTRLTLRLEFLGYEYSVDKFLHLDRVNLLDRGIDRESDNDGDSERESNQSPPPDPESDNDSDSDRESDSDGYRPPPPNPDVVTKLLSHQAARQVEELLLAVEDRDSRNDAYKEDQNTSWSVRGNFTLNLGSLPSDTLRVLELTGCEDLVQFPPASAVVFLRLSSLRLCHCTARMDVLQSLIDAAPALAAIHLEFVIIAQENDAPPKYDYEYYGDFSDRPPPAKTVLLRCPAATVLVLDGCCWKVKDRPWPHNEHNKNTVVAVEINAPRLQRFSFKGVVRPVSLTPPPPDLARADLHFVRRHEDDKNENKKYVEGARKKKSDNDPSRERDLVTFWRLLRSFKNARELKLTVTALEHIAVLSKARRLELLPVLSNLHRLELQGVHRRKAKTAAVAIANLLHCCPALRDLLINLTVAHHQPEYRDEDVFLKRKFRSDRDMSISLFNRYCNSASMTPPEVIAEGAHYEEASEIPGLSQRSFDCLRSSLTRVALQFRLEDGNCFGVNLIKFFAENAMVLEEMRIDAGNGKFSEHITCKVERWIADSFIRRKPGASRFVVLPLKRRL